MGLTHFSILNSLNINPKFTIIEPNKILRKILKKNLNAKFYSDDSQLNSPFDICLITTPPSLHRELLIKSNSRGDKKIFIEKPFGGHSNLDVENLNNISDIYVGYVLRFNPCVQWIKKNVDINDIKFINGKYLSNTIEKKPEGWRNGAFSGVLNEMGSHVIDLIQYILNKHVLTVLKAEKKSVISDVDDIVTAELKTDKNVGVSLYFNWVKKDIRKPVFNLEISMKNGHKFFVDQQQIKELSVNGEIINRDSVVDLNEDVPYYLRGVDFTKQMIELVNNGTNMANVSNALNINRLMNEILNYENNTW